MDRAVFYTFILMLAIIFAAYYAGVSTDAKTFGNAAQQLIFALTGRDSSGKFAAYPSGAPTVA